MTTSLVTPAPVHLPEMYISHADMHRPRSTSLVQFKTDSGQTKTKLVQTGVPVFRSGTFRNSWGEQSTWEEIHIRDFVRNFDYLSTSGSFGHVPVRRGHVAPFEQPMNTLIGYITKLTAEEMQSPVNGEMYWYLLADYEILDKQAIENIDSGLWANRSAEIGGWVTNDESEHWPVFQGFGFVDIPAVEGLHLNGFNKEGSSQEFSAWIPPNKENLMANKSGGGAETGQTASQTTSTGTPVETGQNGPAPLEPVSSTETGQVQTPPENAQTGAPAGAVGSGLAEPVALSEIGVIGAETGPIEQTENPVPPNPATQSVEQPAAVETVTGPSGPIEQTEWPLGAITGTLGAEFRIGGTLTPELFSALTGRLAEYERRDAEGRVSARNSYVDGLANAGKILATDADEAKEFALSLTEAQYAKWTKQQDALPPSHLFGRHAGSATQTSAEQNAVSEEFATALAIVKQHKLGHMKNEALAQTDSYQTLVRLSKNGGGEIPADVLIPEK